MEEKTRNVIDRFNQAFQTHDATDLANLVAKDCLLENTGPAPNGDTYVGQAALGFWTAVASNTGLTWKLEDVFVVGERAIIRWRLSWGKGVKNTVRGVNLMRVRDGQIVEGLGYLKG